MKTISSKKAPKALGPYSQAVAVGNFCFVSMQLGLDPETGKIVAQDVQKQTERAIKNVEAILIEAGLSLSDVVKATLYITDIADFKEINEVYAQFFTHKPARSLVVQSDMPAQAKVALDVIAYIANEEQENLEYAPR